MIGSGRAVWKVWRDLYPRTWGARRAGIVKAGYDSEVGIKEVL